MKYIVGFLAVAVLAIGGYFFPTFTPAAQPAGSVVGNEIYNFLYIHAGEILGSAQAATSTSGTALTLTGNEFSNPNMGTWYVTINTNAGVTFTLPASTTAMCQSLQKNDSRRIWIVNASTTANTLTFAGSASIYLDSASTSAKLDGNTTGSALASLTIFKLPSSNCTAMFDPFY